MRTKTKSFKHPGKHKSVRVMWLSAEYRLLFKRDRKKFMAAYPEVGKMCSFDQQYILT